MKDKKKTKNHLITELKEMRQKLAAMEASIAELTLREKSMMESRELYQIVADNTYDWEFLMNPEAEMIYTSPSCERITGYAASEFISNPLLLFQIIHINDLTRVAESLNRRQVENGFCEIEFRIVSRYQEEKWIALAFQAAYDADGNYVGILGSSRDISVQKKWQKK